MPSLTGKAAIVTGAATGNGRAIVAALTTQGAGVIVNHLDTPDRAEELVEQITAAGGHARCVQGDVSRYDDFARLVDAAEETFGRWGRAGQQCGGYPH